MAQGKVLTYGDLPSTTGARQPQMGCPNPSCEAYGVLYSAERGDYFMHPDNRPVTCRFCDGPLSLGHETTGVAWVMDAETKRTVVTVPVPNDMDDQSGWFCNGCSTYFGVALDACPRCGAPVDYEIGVAHTPQVSLPTNPTEFDIHLRVMHETLVYNMGGYAAEHDEQHAVAANGRRDPKDIWIPHTHPEAT